MKITYYVHDLCFPLREGVRKQAWMMASEMSKKGHEVEIISSAIKKKTIMRKGIKIRYGLFIMPRKGTDVLHYISHPSPLILPLLIFSRSKRQIMTMFDGNLNSFWKRIWSPLLSYYVNHKVNHITLQTDFQKNILRKTNILVESAIIPPLAPSFPQKNNRSKNISLLVMTHLSRYKGIYTILKAFEILRNKFKNMTLIIADSKIQKNKEVYDYINRLNKGDIILKTFIDPSEELSKAHVYLYPIIKPQETFSVPLSLMEAIQVGTPYISTNVGGIPEYFEEDHLVDPGNIKELIKKIKQFINKPQVAKLKKGINNDKVLESFISLYKINEISE